MFENEDWEFDDEDYFKDFNADEVIRNFKEKGNNPERLKSNTEKEVPVNTSKIIFNCSALDEPVSENNSQGNKDAASRKNAILDIFKNNDNTKNNSTLLQSSGSNVSFQNPGQISVFTSNARNDNRKNLVLDIFQNNEVPQATTTHVISKSTVKSVLKVKETNLEIENQFKRKKNVAFTESTNDANNSKKMRISRINNLPQQSNSSSNFEKNQSSILFEENILNKNNDSNSRKQRFLDLLKSPPKPPKVPRVKQAVVRKFPGPAGILPDDIDDSEVINLDSLDENKNKSNKYADVCSQNTKNLFSSGAWQMMMDDLPADFELYDIATVKENALEYSRTYKKVPYFAGIIQLIDYKPNDPHVVLKDLSGKIDALIHHSICKMYPNALGTNVVLLAKDVGLIVTSKKYVCVIITPKNLVSMYSDDARLVETPLLEQLIGKGYNCNLQESQISILDELGIQEDNALNDVNLQHSESTHKNKSNTNSDSGKKQDQNKENSSKDSNNLNSENKKQFSITNDEDDIHDFDFNEDDSWLGVNVDDLHSFKAPHFPSSTPMETNDENFQKKQNESIKETLKNFTFQKKTKSTCQKLNSPITCDRNTSINEGAQSNLIMNNDIHSDTSMDEDIQSNLIKNTANHSSTAELSKNNSSSDLNRSNNEFRSTNESSVKQKLLAFRSKHALTPPPLTAKEQSKNVENKSKPDDKLFDCDGNDTDDEMLSQLDMDAISASFK